MKLTSHDAEVSHDVDADDAADARHDFVTVTRLPRMTLTRLDVVTMTLSWMTLTSHDAEASKSRRRSDDDGRERARVHADVHGDRRRPLLRDRSSIPTSHEVRRLPDAYRRHLAHFHLNLSSTCHLPEGASCILTKHRRFTRFFCNSLLTS